MASVRAPKPAMIMGPHMRGVFLTSWSSGGPGGGGGGEGGGGGGLQSSRVLGFPSRQGIRQESGWMSGRGRRAGGSVVAGV